MQLPQTLRDGIERRAQGVPLATLSRAAATLSSAYREGTAARMAGDVDRIAYLVTRLPATYAAARAALVEIAFRCAGLPFETMLEFGAGPGTASWAATDVFSTLRSITLIEKDRGWIEAGKSLAGLSEHAALQNGAWQQADIAQPQTLAAHDLVVANYAAGELGEKRLEAFAAAGWNATRGVFAVIEPGTPRGFAQILKIRDALLRLGAHMVAPCPHERDCPMVQVPSGKDWCHFAQRVERTSLHRRIKGGSLGFEDEKYAYIAVARAPVALPQARIVGRPQVHSGLIDLALCGRDGLHDMRITRKEKAAFRAARRATWGAAWQAEAGDAEKES